MPVETRSHTQTIMSQNDISAVTANVPHEFTIIQHTPAILKFAGRVNGIMVQDVESFIKSVEFHLEKKRITEPYQQLAEATGYLDLTKGDLTYLLKCESFQNCRTWSDLKDFLRKVYSLRRTTDPVIAIHKVFATAHRDPKHNFCEHYARVFEEMSAFMPILRQSSWMKNDTMTADNFQSLISLGLGLRAFPDSIVANFTREWEPGNSLVEIIAEFDQHCNKVSNLDLSLLVPNGMGPNVNKERNSSSVVKAVANETPLQNSRPQSNRSQPNVNNQFNGSNQRSFYQQASKCYNCNKLGHLSRDCRNTPFCTYHKAPGHATSDSRARKATSRQNTDTGRRYNTHTSSTQQQPPNNTRSYHPPSSSNPVSGINDYGSNYPALPMHDHSYHTPPPLPTPSHVDTSQPNSQNFRSESLFHVQ